GRWTNSSRVFPNSVQSAVESTFARLFGWSKVRRAMPSVTVRLMADSLIVYAFTTHHSPLTTHHSPLTTHRSPLTAHHSPLIRIPMHQPVPQRHEHDLQVKHRVPVDDVVKVELDPLPQRRVAAPAVDLGPAGDAAFDRMAGHVVRNRLAELLDELRPL